jgi:hypothetical protein
VVTEITSPLTAVLVAYAVVRDGVGVAVMVVVVQATSAMVGLAGTPMGE